jgi:hypothetical protein
VSETVVITGACRSCGKIDQDGMWYKPCPNPECLSNNPKRREMGYCPKCASMNLEFDAGASDIEAWSDDTPFPTITIRFVCAECDHAVEVAYDRDPKLHQQSNRLSEWGNYDGDPDSLLDDEEEEDS